MGNPKGKSGGAPKGDTFARQVDSATFRDVLVVLAGEDEDAWPDPQLIGVLEAFSLSYRGKPFDLPLGCKALVGDPRWRFLIQCIRKPDVWVALMQIVYSDQSDKQKIEAIIALAALHGITLTEAQAAWFLSKASGGGGGNSTGPC